MFVSLLILITSLLNMDQWYLPEDPCETGLPDSVEILQPRAPGDVLLLSLDTVAVYRRPGLDASLFGAPLAVGTGVVISGRTDDGWLGFEPGVAQAANSGSFRLRWIAQGGTFVIHGDAGSVPLVWGPEPGITYAMIHLPVLLFAQPDSTSSVLDSLPSSSAAAVVLWMEQWYKVDLNLGSLELDQQGWIRSADVSVNGDLDSIPRFEPGDDSGVIDPSAI